MRLRPWTLDFQIPSLSEDWISIPWGHFFTRAGAIRGLAFRRKALTRLMPLILGSAGYRLQVRDTRTGESEQLDIYHLPGQS